MSIEVKGIKEAQRNLKKLKQAVGQGRREPMEIVCKAGVGYIKKDTKEGKDKDGRPFKPYSPKYAKKKGGKPNLRVSGDMLAAIAYQAWAKKGRIYVKAGLQWVKMKTHAAGGRSGRGTGFAMPQRNPMGVETHVNQLRGMYRRWWEEFAKGLGFG